MATVRSVGTLAQSATGGVLNPTNLAPGLPGTRTGGDVLLCFTSCRSAIPTVATPTGWTSLITSGSVNGITGSWGRIAVFARLVDGSETAPTVTWSGLTTGTAGTPVLARIASMTDLRADLSQLVTVVGAISNQAASSTAAAGGSAITTPNANDTVFVISTRRDDVGTWSTLAASDGTTWAKVFADATPQTVSGADMAMEVQFGTKASAGSVAAKTFTLTGAATLESSGVMIALRESALPPVPTTIAPARVLMATAENSQERTGWQVAIRAAKLNAGHTGVARVQLFERGIARTGQLSTANLSTSQAWYFLAIPQADAESFVDLSAIRADVSGYSATSDPFELRVTELVVEVAPPPLSPYEAAGPAATAQSGNVTPAFPAPPIGGFATNDIFVCMIATGDNVACSLPAGWTQKAAANGGAELRGEVWWKRRAGGDTDTDVLVTHTAGGKITAQVHMIRAPDAPTTGDPFEASAGFTLLSAADSGTFPSVTTASDGALLVYSLVYGQDFVAGGGPAITDPQGLIITERGESEVA